VPERIKITVRASGAHPDVLTIEDAMSQVLDIFEMLENNAPGVRWKLVSASTNSPLSIEAEATSFEPSVDVTVVARAQKQHFERNFREVIRGELPPDPKFRTAAAKRVLARNLNGVGATTIDLENGESAISVTPRVAQQAIDAIKSKPQDVYAPAVVREEIGSVEGRLSDVGTHYNQPAVQIAARSGEIWCRLSPELQERFQDKATYKDVWQHRRVIVRGRIKYGADGGIDYVFATDIRQIEAPEVSIENIADRSFTNGLAVGEYLDRFREGIRG
jgi:hypothetical protein